MSVIEKFDDVKSETSSHPAYKLSNGNVYVSEDGFHFLDYLDPIDEISPEIDEAQLTEEARLYIENSLQSNTQRFDNQYKIVGEHLRVPDAKILDIGCGGGLFLSKVAKSGADVVGIEFSDSRAHYAKTKHGLTIVKQPIESDFWVKSYKEYFDAVTIWDVIEHVNYPAQTLKSAINTLRADGMLFIDTPCRDSFYHRFGEFTYRISGGRFPTFLNTMYSNHLFGHKQIFATSEMAFLLESLNMELVVLEKFHELSFPYSYYLKKILKKDYLVKLALPIATMFLIVFPVKNKMLVVARKKLSDRSN